MRASAGLRLGRQRACPCHWLRWSAKAGKQVSKPCSEARLVHGRTNGHSLNRTFACGFCVRSRRKQAGASGLASAGDRRASQRAFVGDAPAHTGVADRSDRLCDRHKFLKAFQALQVCIFRQCASSCSISSRSFPKTQKFPAAYRAANLLSISATSRSTLSRRG